MAIPLALGIGGGLLAGAGALSSFLQGNRANDLQEEALGIQRGLFQQGAPLRRLSVDRLLAMLSGNQAIDPNAPDLGAAFQDPTNPFSAPLQRLGERDLVRPAPSGGGLPLPAPAPRDVGGALPAPGVRLPPGGLAPIRPRLPTDVRGNPVRDRL